MLAWAEASFGLSRTRLDKARNRLLETSRSAEGFAEPIMCLRNTGLESDRLPARSKRLFGTAEVEQDMAQVGPCAYKRGVEL